MFKTLRPVWAARVDRQETAENGTNGYPVPNRGIMDGFGDSLDFSFLDGDWIFDYPMFEAPGQNGAVEDPNVSAGV